MSIELYYFSGTGNSLYIARELQKQLSETKLISILSLLQLEKIQTKGKTIGLVFPIYLSALPIPVRLFMEKADFSSAEYIFSIMTRIGTFHIANRIMNRILKKQKKRLNAYFVINMAQNSPTSLVPGKGDRKWLEKINPEKLKALDDQARSQLKNIIPIIQKQEHPDQKPINLLLLLFDRLLENITKNTKTKIPFYTDKTCNSCGTCEKICPSDKIKIKNGKPVWQDEVQCYYCYACFNYCPLQSILVKNKYDLKKGRYSHPGITAQDIMNQKICRIFKDQ